LLESENTLLRTKTDEF